MQRSPLVARNGAPSGKKWWCCVENRVGRWRLQTRENVSGERLSMDSALDLRRGAAYCAGNYHTLRTHGAVCSAVVKAR